MNAFVHSQQIQSWKRRVGQMIRRMDTARAMATLNTIDSETGRGTTIRSETIANLTGGLNSQSINSHVIRCLATKAGIVRN